MRIGNLVHSFKNFIAVSKFKISDSIDPHLFLILANKKHYFFLSPSYSTTHSQQNQHKRHIDTSLANNDLFTQKTTTLNVNRTYCVYEDADDA